MLSSQGRRTRHRELWGRIIRLRDEGMLSGDALHSLVDLQLKAHRLAGGETTVEMVEQLENWIKVHEGEQLAEIDLVVVDELDAAPMPSEADRPLDSDLNDVELIPIELFEQVGS